MSKIYWYRRKNGDILDESEDSAWRVHRAYLDPRQGITYLGWSNGEFINAFKKGNLLRRNENNIIEDFSAEAKAELKEVIAKELEVAANNMQPPVDKSRKNFIGSMGQVNVLGQNDNFKNYRGNL